MVRIVKSVLLNEQIRLNRGKCDQIRLENGMLYIYIYIYIYINILYINRATGFGATLLGTISIHGSMIGQGCQSC